MLSEAHILMRLRMALTCFTDLSTDHSSKSGELESISGGFHSAGSGGLVCAKLKLYRVRWQDEACVPHLFIMFSPFPLPLFFSKYNFEMHLSLFYSWFHLITLEYLIFKSDLKVHVCWTLVFRTRKKNFLHSNHMSYSQIFLSLLTVKIFPWQNLNALSHDFTEEFVG